MKQYFILLILIIHSSFAYSFDRSALLKAFGSIVMVRGYTESGSLAYGSGVIVGKGEVITNCHVLRRTKAPWVSQGEDSYSITDIRIDTWHDLCLLNIHNLKGKPIPIGSSRDLIKGQSLAAIGHSSGSPVPLTSGGYVVSTYEYDKGKIILSSAKFRLGASGSGLFDMKGNLVGINTFKTTGYGSYYAMPIEWLKDLRKKDKQKNFLVSGKALWEEDENKKPFFLQIAIPKVKENWNNLFQVTKKWIEKEENNSEAWYEYGFANEKILNFEEALNSYNKSIVLDKNNSDSMYRSALLHKRNGDLIKAKKIQKNLLIVDEVKGLELKNLL
jgi:serine protease Do|tara:strand:+ start:677 stop:1666 length:990 start_codon:yes stop_codon:yes gene_type:complete